MQSRFLQSHSSNLLIDEYETLQEHGLATVACLLSGLTVFNNSYQEYDRQLRLIKGLHGFHVYATEYWTDYLFFHVQSATFNATTSSLLALANILACRLDAADTWTGAELEYSTETSGDPLQSLSQYPVLLKHVRKYLRARSVKTLEAELLNLKGE